MVETKYKETMSNLKDNLKLIQELLDKGVEKPPIELQSLGYVKLVDIHSLPNEPGIYLVCDNAQKVFYVGKSQNLRKRLSSHEHMCKFEEVMHAQVKYKALSEDLCSQVESSCISYYKPTFNQVSGANSSTKLENDLDALEGLDTLTYFGTIKSVIKDLESISKQLQPKALNFVNSIPSDKKQIEAGGFKASTRVRKIYQYSIETEDKLDDLKELQSEIKTIKKKEVESGLAKVIEEKIDLVIRSL